MTAFWVPANDFTVVTLNQNALAQVVCPKKLAIIPGATHLFEESGALEQVALHAQQWFSQYLLMP